MKENTCNYSDHWQPYINDYDKFEYDVKLLDGIVIENCYPNARKFNSISDEHDAQGFHESLVAEIRFSNNPKMWLNKNISLITQYEREEEKEPTYFNPTPTEFIIQALPTYGYEKKFTCKGKHQYREESKVWVCQCGRKIND